MKTQEVSRKKTSQNIFYQRSPSLSKCNLKYENICLLNCSSPNIWAVVYIIVFNSSLNLIHIFPAACFNCNWFHWISSIFSWPCSTRSQIYIKSETGQRIISKYFVWNNVNSRKWEWRIRFCLISLMQLFKGDSHIVHCIILN